MSDLTVKSILKCSVCDCASWTVYVIESKRHVCFDCLLEYQKSLDQKSLDIKNNLIDKNIVINSLKKILDILEEDFKVSDAIDLLKSEIKKYESR